jgi:hypothetical protein
VWSWSSRRAERPAVYEKDREALIALWEASDRICSKRLKPLIPVLLPAWSGTAGSGWMTKRAV